jgi:hypothetical protein
MGGKVALLKHGQVVAHYKNIAAAKKGAHMREYFAHRGKK